MSEAAAPALEGARLERLVVDRRIDQLVLFLAAGDEQLEVVFHRVDLERLDTTRLRALAEQHQVLTGSATTDRSDGAQVQRLDFADHPSLEIVYRDRAVARR